jgi:hypothetical protein
MSDFTPITTQEDFDKAIQKRLAQKDREAEEKYRDYMAPDKVDALKADYDKKISDAAALVKDAQAKLAKHDEEIASITQRAVEAEGKLLKSSIANKHGIPLDLADRLVGTTEDEIEKDAQNFAGYLGSRNGAPMRSNDSVVNTPSSTDQAFMSLLSQLTHNE